MPRRTNKFSVPLEARGQRLDHFLATQFHQLSRSQIQKCIRDGGVTVGGKEIRRASLRLRGGEKLAVVFPEPAAAAGVPEDIPLEVLYEDEDLAVLNKPAGLVVHAGAGPARRGGTLVNACCTASPPSHVGGPCARHCASPRQAHLRRFAHRQD
jgi:23S rRNA pseudouridine1911/1915/1917 synthase